MATRRRSNPLVAGIPEGYNGSVVAWVRKQSGLGRPGDKKWVAHARMVAEVLRDNGVKLGKKLGCGAMGCAFEWRGHPNRVVKITSDPSEAAAAQRVLEARKAGRALASVVKFYKVFLVPGTNLAVILQERLDPLSWREKTMIARRADDIYAAGFEPSAARHAAARSIGWRYLVPARRVEGLMEIAPKLKTVGVTWTDLHEGNVMRDRRTGRLKAIDLGVSRSGPIDVPALEPRGEAARGAGRTLVPARANPRSKSLAALRKLRAAPPRESLRLTGIKALGIRLANERRDIDPSQYSFERRGFLGPANARHPRFRDIAVFERTYPDYTWEELQAFTRAHEKTMYARVKEAMDLAHGAGWQQNPRRRKA